MRTASGKEEELSVGYNFKIVISFLFTTVSVSYMNYLVRFTLKPVQRQEVRKMKQWEENLVGKDKMTAFSVKNKTALFSSQQQEGILRNTAFCFNVTIRP